MIFVPDAVDDIVRYYRKTFVKFQETGDKLFFIQSVDRREIRGIDEDGNDFVLYLHKDAPYTVDFVLPHKSFYQDGKYAHQLLRIPAKQYQRGISEANTYIQRLDSISSYTKRIVEFETLKKYVNKQLFPTFQQAVINKARHHSTALSPRMAISHTEKHLLIDQQIVAKVDVTNKTVVVVCNVFRPEVEAVTQGSLFKVV